MPAPLTLGTFDGIALRFENNALVAATANAHRKAHIPIAETCDAAFGALRRPARPQRADDERDLAPEFDPATGWQTEQTLGATKRELEIFQARASATDARRALTRITFNPSPAPLRWTLAFSQPQAFDRQNLRVTLRDRTTFTFTSHGATFQPELELEPITDEIERLTLNLAIPADQTTRVEFVVESHPEYNVGDTIILCAPDQVLETTIVASCLGEQRQYQAVIDLPRDDQTPRDVKRLARVAEVLARLAPRRVVLLDPFDAFTLRVICQSPLPASKIFIVPEAAASRLTPDANTRIATYTDARDLARVAREVLGSSLTKTQRVPADNPRVLPFVLRYALKQGNVLVPYAPGERAAPIAIEQVADRVNRDLETNDAIIVEEGLGVGTVIASLYAHHLGARLYVNHQPDASAITRALDDVGAQVQNMIMNPARVPDPARLSEPLIPLITANVDEYIRRAVNAESTLTAFTAAMPYAFVRAGEVDWSRLPLGHVTGETTDLALLALREVMSRALARPPISLTMIFDPGFFWQSETDWTTERLTATVAQPLALIGNEANRENLFAFGTTDGVPVEEMIFVTHGAREQIVLKTREGADDLVADEVIEAQLDLKSAPVIFNNSCLSWVSVGRAFLRAGARGYVGTLWSVASAEAARLAQQMLAQLTRGETLGRALAASQIDDELTRRAYIYVGAANATLGAGILTAEQRAGLWSALEVLSRALRALSDAGHPDAARVLYRKFRELGESFIALAQRPEYAIPSEQVIDYYLEDAYYLVKTATQRGAPRTIWEDARERLEAALAQLDALQIPAEDALPRRALAWGRLGYIERTRGDLDRALEHYRASRDALLQLNDARRAAKCESQIAYIQWMRGDEHAAEEEYAKSFQLRAGLNDPREMLEIYSQRAAFWVDRGRYADALGAFQRAEELNRVVQDRYYQAHNLLNLGKMFVELGEGDKAETCFDDSQKLFDELKDTAGMYELAYARGSVMAKQNRWLDAQNYFTVALEFARTLQTEQPTADALYMLGVAHHAQGHLADAVDCYRQSLALVTALGNPSAELATRLDLARAYAAQNQSALARDEYARALEIARAVNDAAAGDIHNELVGLPM